MYLERTLPVRDVVSALAVSGAGELLALGYRDGGVEIVHLPSGKLLQVLKQAGGKRAHQDSAYALSFSPNGDVLISGGLDTTVRSWDVGDGSLLAAYSGHKMAVVSVACSPDGEWVASCGDTTVRIWNARSGEHRFTYQHESYTTSAVWSQDGESIVSGEMLGNVQIWDVSNGEKIVEYLGQAMIPGTKKYDEADFFSIGAIACTDQLIASSQSLEGEEAGTLHIWEAKTGKTCLSYPGHPHGPA